MTTITFKDGVMCGDRVVNSSGTAHCQARKIDDIDGWLFGGAGAAAEWSIIAGFIRHMLSVGKTPAGHLGMTGYSDDENRQTGILVSPSGQIHVLDRDKAGNIFCYPVDALFAATGSGRDVALGAMAAGATAEEAVAIAGQFDLGTGPISDRIYLRRTASHDAPTHAPPPQGDPAQVRGELPEGFTKWEAPELGMNGDPRRCLPEGVTARTPVVVLHPYGYEVSGLAGEFHWATHLPFERDRDIIAYRIITAPPTQTEASSTEGERPTDGESLSRATRCDTRSQRLGWDGHRGGLGYDEMPDDEWRAGWRQREQFTRARDAHLATAEPSNVQATPERERDTPPNHSFIEDANLAIAQKPEDLAADEPPENAKDWLVAGVKEREDA